MSKLRDLELEFLHGVPVHLTDEMAEQIKALFLELVETPKGHIPNEECCESCDLRAELREKINNL